MQLLKRGALLCVALIVFAASERAETVSEGVPPATNSSPARSGRPADRPQAGQLQGDARILHALDRFTFGPRPGDVEVVRAMGLEKWFEAQLHPASLDERGLDARLAQFPAMQWSTQELMYRLPGNAVIQQALNGRLPVPQSGILRPIYENQMERVAARQQGRALTGASMASGAPSPTMQMDGGGEAPAAEASPAGESQDAAQADAVLDLPPKQRVQRLAAMPQPELDSFIQSLRPVERMRLEAGLNPGQALVVEALRNPQRAVINELIGERLARDIYSNAQLQEVMTDFWLNHFNVFLGKNPLMPYYLASYAREAIRPHALGKFEDLLEAVAHSPAMLLYLDNASSIGPDSVAARRAEARARRNASLQGRVPDGINENYGRELMELHTLGVNGGYTQADVIQAARILTGWTVAAPQRGGGFAFNPNRHEPGAETVMGRKFKDRGEEQGRELLHFLATRPATAHFICGELAERLVSDHPPQSLVDRMARTWMDTGGDISAVLTTMFHSPEFWSTNAERAKVKTPLEYVVSAVRASNADVENFLPLANVLRRMGMPLYGCVPPDGYSWQSSAWTSAGDLVDRLNFALALAADRLPGITVDWAQNGDDSARAPAEEEARLQALLLPGGVSASTQAAVLGQFQRQNAQGLPQAMRRPISAQMRSLYRPGAPTAREREDRLLAGLLLGSPEFQRR
jgi:uncharacterized protein (DUF1800 family)